MSGARIPADPALARRAIADDGVLACPFAGCTYARVGPGTFSGACRAKDIEALAEEHVERLHDPVPCSACGTDNFMVAVICRHCGKDPNARWIKCPDCAGTGTIETSSHGGQFPGDPIECDTCHGHKEVESPCLQDREAALAEIRGGNDGQ